MEKEQILEFTRRISQSNGSGLTLITYDILFANLAEAKKAYQEEEWDTFKTAVRQSEKAIQELIDTLNFSYELAKNLYQIYVFCRDELAKAMAKRSISEIEETERLMRKLYEGFQKAAKSDTSEPIMKNAEQVYAGYTYGRGDVTENSQELNRSRGFLV